VDLFKNSFAEIEKMCAESTFERSNAEKALHELFVLFDEDRDQELSK